MHCSGASCCCWLAQKLTPLDYFVPRLCSTSCVFEIRSHDKPAPGSCKRRQHDFSALVPSKSMLKTISREQRTNQRQIRARCVVAFLLRKVESQIMRINLITATQNGFAHNTSSDPTLVASCRFDHSAVEFGMGDQWSGRDSQFPGGGGVALGWTDPDHHSLWNANLAETGRRQTFGQSGAIAGETSRMLDRLFPGRLVEEQIVSNHDPSFSRIRSAASRNGRREILIHQNA